jgi:hypothetical protein
MGSLIFYFSIFITLFVITQALFAHSYKYPLLALLLARPVIDATWSYHYAGFSLIYVLNGAFVLIFLYRLLFGKEKLYSFKCAGLFGAYLIILTFVSFNVLMKSGYLIALEFFFKSFFMPLSFYLFYEYFHDKENGKLLCTTLIVAGFFPLTIALVQMAIGNVGRFRPSRGLMRNAGFYHDNVSTRTYFVLTLIAVLLYGHYFLKKTEKLKRICLFIISGLLIIGLYYQYSKAIIVTAIIWVILFSFFRRKAHIIALIFAVFLIVNAFTNNRVFSDIRQVFSKEIDLVTGRSADTNILAGRILMWNSFLSYWRELPIMEKMIGPGIAEWGFHNDYIRMLFNGGILFLSTSVLFMFILVIKTCLNLMRDGEFIHFVALLSLSYFLVEAIGTLPGTYPNLQTVVFGLVSLSLNRKFQWKHTGVINDESGKKIFIAS